MSEEALLKKLDRAIGGVVGLATGDALGSTVEFTSRASIFERYGSSGQTEMRGGGVFGWQVGQYTDDGQMMMCLLESLVETNSNLSPGQMPRLDVDDLGRRFLAWLDSGPPDVGNTVHIALERLRNGTPATLSGDAAPQNQANGAIMRCAPVAVLFHQPKDLALLQEYSLLSAAPTHRSPVAANACVVVNSIIMQFINAADFQDAFDKCRETAGSEWRDILTDWDKAGRPHRGNSGWAVSTVLTALHCLVTTESFEQAVIKAVNGGDDADTVGAVTGELAGALYGYSAIPSRWLDVLQDHDKLVGLGRTLFEIGER